MLAKTKTAKTATPASIDQCEPFRTEKAKLDGLVNELRSIDGRLAEIETAFDDATGKAAAIAELQSELAKAEAENATAQKAWVAFRVAWHRNRTRDPGAYNDFLSKWQGQRRGEHNTLLEAAQKCEGRVGRLRQRIAAEEARPRPALATLRHLRPDIREDIDQLQAEQTRLLGERPGLESAIRQQRATADLAKRQASRELTASILPELQQHESAIADAVVRLLEQIRSAQLKYRLANGAGANLPGLKQPVATVQQALHQWLSSVHRIEVK